MKQTQIEPHAIIVRQLTGSDLGWFALPRAQGRASGNQRAVQFNASIVAQLLTDIELQKGVDVWVRRAQEKMAQLRPLRLNERNFRLMGPKVEGEDLGSLHADDWMLITVGRTAAGALHFEWDVVMRAVDPSRHASLHELLRSRLARHMLLLKPSDPLFERLNEHRGSRKRTQSRPDSQKQVENATPAKPRDKRPSATPSMPSARPLKKQKAPATRGSVLRSDRTPASVRVRRPNILAEILRRGLVLTAEVQADFLSQLDQLARGLRELLADADMLIRRPIDHAAAWGGVNGKRIGFVDGGVASIPALGAEPLAIRVGAYCVIPGDSSSEREEFSIERYIVDELFNHETPESHGFFDGESDPSKLRDAARMSLETAAAVSLLTRNANRPEIVFVHGPLVNPVSPYGLDGFPSFTRRAISLLLPDQGHRAGRDAQFVAVHLAQLAMINASSIPTVGVVERASTSHIVSDHLLEELRRRGSISASTKEELLKNIQRYRLNDSLLFECVLEEGEYLEPIAVEKNDPRRRPPRWPEIANYPKPWVTYVKPTVHALPVRVELLPMSLTPPEMDNILDLVIHMSRLLPRYAFPAGLDIVDRFAKIPAWMSQSSSSAVASQVLRRAMELGNPQMINVARRYLTGNVRDWLFRPKA